LALRKFALDATVVTAARIFQVAVNVLALPVLARLLHPSDFGLMAAANSVLFLTSVLADAGFASSLVKTNVDEVRAWSSVFWVTTAWSACLALVLALLAVPMGRLLKQADVAPLIAALAVIPFIQGVLAAPVAELQQRKRFGWIGASDVLGSISGVAAAVLFAIAGTGPWALIAQSLALVIVKAAVIALSTRFRPRFAFDRHLISEHLHFALNTGAFAIVLFFGTQMENILIARSLGSGSLGLYSMAYRIMNMPSLLCSAFTVLYPRLVKLHEDKQALRELVLTVTMVFAIIVFPPMAMLCVSSKSVFTVLFSARWTEAATVFSYLAPVGALQAVSGIHVHVLMAVGRTDTRLRIAVEYVILWMIVLLSVVHLGINAVAIGLLLSYLAYYPRFLLLFLRPIECSVLDYARVMLVPLCVSAAIASAHVALRPPLTPRFETCAAALECLMAYLVIGLLMRRCLLDALANLRPVLKRADEEV
jgi:PST family polysaccharide transporter